MNATTNQEATMYRTERRYRAYRQDGSLAIYSYLCRAIAEAKTHYGYVAERGRVVFSTNPLFPLS